MHGQTSLEQQQNHIISPAVRTCVSLLSFAVPRSECGINCGTNHTLHKFTAGRHLFLPNHHNSHFHPPSVSVAALTQACKKSRQSLTCEMSWNPLTEVAKPVLCTFSRRTLVDSSAEEVSLLQCGRVSKRSSHIQWVVSDYRSRGRLLLNLHAKSLVYSLHFDAILTASKREQSSLHQQAREAHGRRCLKLPRPLSSIPARNAGTPFLANRGMLFDSDVLCGM